MDGSSLFGRQPEPEGRRRVDLRAVGLEGRRPDVHELADVDDRRDAVVVRRTFEPLGIEGRLEAEVEEALVHRLDALARPRRVIKLQRLPWLAEVRVGVRITGNVECG